MTSDIKHKAKKHKLLSIFSCLTSEEQKSFNKTVSQSHKEGSDIAVLMAALYANRKRLDSDNLSEEIQSKRLAHLSSKNLSNLMSKIKLALEDWLVCYDLKRSKYDRELALIKSYNDRGVFSEADKVAERLEKQLTEDPIFDLRKTKVMYLLKDSQYYSDNPIKYDVGPPILNDLVTYFNNFYREHIHLYNTELYNWGGIQQHDFSALITNNLLSVKHSSETDQIIILEKLESMIGNNNIDAFNSIQQLLFENKITHGSLLHILLFEYCINACTKFLRKNELEDINVLVELYEYGFSSEVILRAGSITYHRFYSIISVLATTYSFEKVKAFIEKWIHVVKANYPSSTTQIAHAVNCFKHEKYKDILMHLRGLKYEDRKQKYIAIMLELIALYEEKNYDLLQTSINNYMRTLRRNKPHFSSHMYEVNLNMMKVMNFLVNGDREAVKNIIDSGQPLIYRKWIMKQIEKKR